MSITNDSTSDVLLIHQQIYQVALTEGLIAKVFFAILMSLFFTYLNAIMVYTLCSKAVFKETPRYILFTHMLFNDSIQLFVTSLLYIIGLAYFKLVMAACAVLVIISGTTFRNAPLNLALMSLERYVAISFPLRHAEIATQKRTYIAVGLTWCMSLVHYFTDFVYSAAIEPKFLTLQIFCTRERLFTKQWQVNLHEGLNIFLFVTMSVIMLFTYISIFLTARSVSSKKDTAVKAHKTVLLHIIQMGLCLTSFFYSFIERTAAMSSSSSKLFLDLRYLNYIFVLILPRCLSPLIYGLRDDALRHLFIFYFRFGTSKRKSTVNVH